MINEKESSSELSGHVKVVIMKDKDFLLVEASVISKQSEFFNTMISEFGSIQLIEDDMLAALHLFTMISREYTNITVWDKTLACLSDKWMLKEYVNIYAQIAETFLKNLCNYLTVSGIDSQVDGIYLRDPKNRMKLVNNVTGCFIRKDDTKLTWEICNESGEQLYAKQLKEVPSLHNLVATRGWTVIKQDYRHCPQPGLQWSTPWLISDTKDINTFCEIVEVFLSHPNYARPPLRNTEDLFLIFSQNSSLRTQKILRRFLSNEELLDFVCGIESTEGSWNLSTKQKKSEMEMLP